MAICPTCGKVIPPVPENPKFCLHCGAKLPEPIKHVRKGIPWLAVIGAVLLVIGGCVALAATGGKRATATPYPTRVAVVATSTVQVIPAAVTMEPSATPNPSATPGPSQTVAPSNTARPTSTIAPSATKAPSATPKPTPTATSSQRILHVDGAETVLVAIDTKSMDELTKTLLAKDYYGLAQMLLEGRVFEVANDSAVLVIDMGLFTRRIRILEGTQAGAAGWVPYEWVK